MFQLRFHTENEAFQGDGYRLETARILNKVVQKVNDGEVDGDVYDINGNNIGYWYYTKIEDRT